MHSSRLSSAPRRVWWNFISSPLSSWCVITECLDVFFLTNDEHLHVTERCLGSGLGCLSLTYEPSFAFLHPSLCARSLSVPHTAIHAYRHTCFVTPTSSLKTQASVWPVLNHIPSPPCHLMLASFQDASSTERRGEEAEVNCRHADNSALSLTSPYKQTKKSALQQTSACSFQLDSFLVTLRG